MTDDGRTLNLHRIRRKGDVPGRPVLLVGGLAMRANAFYGPASQRTLVDALVEAGRDVWVENWRTSIDLPQSDYSLDEAAVYDHPAAVETICASTGADRIDAVAHCMGSASLSLSIVAGLVPELEYVVCSAVSLHIRLAARSRRRLALEVPVGALFMPGVDPQWAARAPTTASALFVRRGVLQMRRYYRDPLVAATTFFYGGEPEALWRRANIDADTLAWTAREFGYAPLRVFSPDAPLRSRAGPPGARVRPGRAAGEPAVGRSAARHPVHVPRRGPQPLLPPQRPAASASSTSTRCGPGSIGSATSRATATSTPSSGAAPHRHVFPEILKGLEP